MADNFTVLNSASATVTFRSTDNGAGVQINMSIPTNKLGTAMIGSTTVSNSIPFNLATDSPALPIAAATVPTLLTVVSTSGAPAAVAIKNTSGTLKVVSGYNNNTAAPVFLKIFNVSAAGVVVGTTLPKWTVGFAPGAPFCAPLDDGAAFTTALSYVITKLIPDTDTTAVGIDDLHAVVTFL